MGYRKTTIHDIARKLNISASTVSRALHDHPRISVAMRQSVKKAAAEMGYVPDVVASGLRKGKRSLLGMIVPHIDRHFFAQVISGVEEVAHGAGYHVLVTQSGESYSRESDLALNLGSGLVDGVLASVSMETKSFDHFSDIIQKGIPVVFFDRVADSISTDKVVVDDYQGAFLATEHLIHTGKRKIGHLAGPVNVGIYRLRLQGYLDAMKQHRLKVPREWIIPDTITQSSGYEAMNRMLQLKYKPEAIFASGDFSALGAMLKAREAGLDIPADLAIVGFANEPFTSLLSPGLSSVDQHPQEMGRQAARLLLERLEKPEEMNIARKISLQPDLLIRGSSARASV